MSQLTRLLKSIPQDQWFIDPVVSGSGFAVLDSDGNSFACSTTVLDSDGNGFSVSQTVLDSDGNGFSVI